VISRIRAVSAYSGSYVVMTTMSPGENSGMSTRST
jgi:hypothetical protein